MLTYHKQMYDVQLSTPLSSRRKHRKDMLKHRNEFVITLSQYHKYDFDNDTTL